MSVHEDPLNPGCGALVFLVIVSAVLLVLLSDMLTWTRREYPNLRVTCGDVVHHPRSVSFGQHYTEVVTTSGKSFRSSGCIVEK